MYIHKEGYPTLTISALFFISIYLIASYMLPAGSIWLPILLVFLVLDYLFLMSFFRMPNRPIPTLKPKEVLAPADGKVVVIEEVVESEFLKDKRIQVSIFMSPANVHVNRNPIDGSIAYTKYHSGKYLVAWHPKSSTENERFTSVFSTKDGSQQILVRQIAGKLARKICNYLQVGDNVKQGEEMGFIKFGSRVDLFFPLGTKILIKMDQTIIGGETILAELT